MLWMSGASLRWLGVLAWRVIAMVPVAWTYLLRDYQKERLPRSSTPTLTSRAPGYQLHQAQIAVRSGGVVGKGLTNGTQTQGDLLPVQATDFVFATLAEELGFVGGVVLFVLFALLLWRVLGGWRSQDPFGTLFAGGLASMILFQLVVNVGMVLGVMPITGIPLPFVTHGGASLVSMAAGPRASSRASTSARRAPPGTPPRSICPIVDACGRRPRPAFGRLRRSTPAQRMTQAAVVPWTRTVNRTIPKIVPCSSADPGRRSAMTGRGPWQPPRAVRSS